MMALKASIQHALPEFIRAYRFVVLYALLHYHPNDIKTKVLTSVNLEIDDDIYQDMVHALMDLSQSYKSMVYNNYTIEVWCPMLYSGVDLKHPNKINLNQFSLLSKNALDNLIRSTRTGVKQNNQHDLEQIIKPELFIQIEQLASQQLKALTPQQLSIVRNAYLLWLINAYSYYWSNGSMVKTLEHIRTNDHEWDRLSQQLNQLKHLIKPEDLPVLFHPNYEAGQSLFWLKKESYPTSIRWLFE